MHIDLSPAHASILLLFAERPEQRLRENRIAGLSTAHPDLWEDLQQLCERDLVEYVRAEKAYYLAPDGFDAAREVYWMRRREAEAEMTPADLVAIEADNRRARRRAKRALLIQQAFMAFAGAVGIAVLVSLLFSTGAVRDRVPAAAYPDDQQAAIDSVLQRFVDSLEGR